MFEKNSLTNVHIHIYVYSYCSSLHIVHPEILQLSSCSEFMHYVRLVVQKYQMILHTLPLWSFSEH